MQSWIIRIRFLVARSGLVGWLLRDTSRAAYHVHSANPLKRPPYVLLSSTLICSKLPTYTMGSSAEKVISFLIIAISSQLLSLHFATSTPLKLGIEQYQPHSFTLNWTINDFNGTLTKLRISVDNLAPEEYHITYTGERFINFDTNQATIFVHQANTKYNVCMSVVADGSELHDCITAKTIPIIRPSSLVGVLLVTSFFVICIAVGAIMWKIHTTTLNPARSEYLKTDANGNGDTVHLTRRESISIEA